MHSATEDVQNVRYEPDERPPLPVFLGLGLQYVAHNDGDAVNLEFAAATDDTNLEDRLALLGERVAGPPVEEEISLRLLLHRASSVRHHQFHDADVITVRVGPATSL